MLCSLPPPTVLATAHLHVTPHQAPWGNGVACPDLPVGCLCTWCSPPRMLFSPPAPPAEPDPPPRHLFTAQPRCLCSGMQPPPPPRALPEQLTAWVPGSSSLARWGTCVQEAVGVVGESWISESDRARSKPTQGQGDLRQVTRLHDPQLLRF